MDVFKMIQRTHIKIVEELEENIIAQIQTIANECGIAEEIALNKKAIRGILVKAEKRKVCYDKFGYPYCINCGGYVMLGKIARHRPKYCPECGQALEWEG